jgi:DNA-binding response OmpR family regulator
MDSEKNLIPRKAILVIEDDESIRESLKILLNLEGYIVRSAENGLEAMKMLKNYQQDVGLMIVDLMMPIMDWLSFLKQKRDSTFKSVPTIIFSASVQRGQRIEGAAAIMAKPMDFHRFLSVVKQHYLH